MTARIADSLNRTLANRIRCLPVGPYNSSFEFIDIRPVLESGAHGVDGGSLRQHSATGAQAGSLESSSLEATRMWEDRRYFLGGPLQEPLVPRSQESILQAQNPTWRDRRRYPSPCRGLPLQGPMR